MTKLLSLIRRSIHMDLAFMATSNSVADKIDFIIKKYFLLIKHFFYPFIITKSKIEVFSQDFYYESNLGLTLYQVSLIHHARLFLDLDMDNQNVILFDIGANVGCFSLVFKKVFPNSQIYDFEPVPDVYKCLTLNVKGIDGVKAENFGLSDVPGTFKFLYDSKNTEMGMLSDAGNITVQIETLDAYVERKNIPYISFLKIDTETFEKHVLLGAKKTLARTKYILLEVNYESSNINYTISDLMSTLSSENYNFQLLKIVNFLDKNIEDAKILDFLLVNRKYEED